MNKLVKTGVVGSGRMGEFHVLNLAEILDVELVAVTDINPEKEKVAKRYKSDFYTDYKELYGKVDAVSIAVPTALHFETTKNFLEHGIHVLLEKPIAPTLQEAEELFKIANKNKCILQVGHLERFNGAVQEVYKILDTPLFIESRRMGPYEPRVKNDCVVLDLMIHDLDIILNLIDEDVIELNATGGSVFSERTDYAMVTMKFKSGCIATLLASRATQNKIRTMSISQKESYVFLDYTDQDIHIHRRASSHHTLTPDTLKYQQESIIERIFVHKENALKLQLKNFTGRVREGFKPLNPEKEVRSIKLALEIRNQIEGR
ncbi:MAG: Gfo/Idh/MocA family oxidoreductase [Nitrospinae bacterium]|nr:Gfo/Idh/MocA family oxidoreductase [Nitrospinota bacterium]